MQPTFNKWKIIVPVIIVILLIIFFATRKSPTPIPTQQTQNPTSIPEQYVRKTKDEANQAVFVFDVPIKEEDIVGKNIKHCTLNASVAAEYDNSEPDCVETVPENALDIKYDKSTRTLTVFDPNPGHEWGMNNGPFRIGCAACMSAVEFSGIHTTDGKLLPDLLVNVY